MVPVDRVAPARRVRFGIGTPMRAARIPAAASLRVPFVPLVILALAWLTVGVGPAHAGPLFAARFLSYDTGTNSRSVVLADLNRDGIPDFVTSNFSSATVSVALGNGDGTFK